MAINWADNKVFNPNLQQKAATYERSITNKPTANVRSEDSIQVEKYMNNQSIMNDNIMNDNMMNGNMMNGNMMNGNMMSDNMMHGNMNNGNMNNRMMSEEQITDDMMNRQGPPPVMDKYYIAGYLKENIGKNVRAEFAIAGGFFVDKAGVLKEVGVNYFVLEDNFSRAKIMCDLYSVKFVTIM